MAKLTETTYFGLMIAWAQELEGTATGRVHPTTKSSRSTKRSSLFPRVQYFPGIIGGHCVMPNIDILRRFHQSAMLEAIRTSNEMKVERETHAKPAKAVSAAAEKETVPA